MPLDSKLEEAYTMFFHDLEILLILILILILIVILILLLLLILILNDPEQPFLQSRRSGRAAAAA